MNTNYFYHDKPLFGLDIGFNSVKVLQIERNGLKQQIRGYGATQFDSGAIKDGVIADAEALAREIQQMFEKHIIGDISTRRVAVAIPSARTYTRTMSLPPMKEKEITEAVRLEAEQYIPVPLEDLYLDYELINQNKDGIELIAVAAPKKQVDSYMDLIRLLGLEAVALEPTISAASRLFNQTTNNDTPTVLIDLGSISTDLTMYDKTLLVTGTVQGGGDNMTEVISASLGVTKQEASVIKIKYGLGVSKKQAEITAALEPMLKQLVKEIRRMIRYYEERSSDPKMVQIVTMGGGANMPGLSEYLTSTLRLPVRMCDPWQQFEFGDLQPPHIAEKSMYVTVAGLALLDPSKAFAS